MMGSSTNNGSNNINENNNYYHASSIHHRPKFLLPSVILRGVIPSSRRMGSTIRSHPSFLAKVIFSFAMVWLSVIVYTYYYHTTKLDSIIGQHNLFRGTSRRRSSRKFPTRVVGTNQVVVVPSKNGSGTQLTSPQNKGSTISTVTKKLETNSLPKLNANIQDSKNPIPYYQNTFAWSDAGSSTNNKFGPAMSACLLIKDENPRLIEWLAYHYTVVKLRYLVVAIDPESLTSPRDILLQRWGTFMDIQIWEDEHYMNQTQLTVRLARTLRANSNNDMEEFIQLHRERQKTFLAQCNLYHQAHNRTWVAHIDVDEYISYNYIHDQQEPSPPSEERHNLTLFSHTNTATIFDYFHRIHPPTSACVGMVRVLFGSTTYAKSNNNTVEDPNIHLNTLSYFHHENLTTLGLFGKQKVLMDVSRIHPSLLQPTKVFSIHTPIMRPRHVCPINYFTHKAYSESILRVHHYIGSWESYSSKVDVRRDKEIFNERASVSAGPIYDVKDWYDQFQKIMGGKNIANQMLAGAGIIEKEWSEIVAKQHKSNNNNVVASSCALLFFSSSSDRKVGSSQEQEQSILSSVEKNIIHSNPSCEIFVHTFAKLTEESLRYFPDHQSHFFVSEVQQQQDPNMLLPVRLHQQWYSIQSVWNFMEAFEQKNWIRFRRVGMFSLDVVYYDPVPVFDKSNQDAVVPSTILSDTAGDDKRWSSTLFYGARAAAKIWATDRFKSIEGYRQWLNSTSNDSDNTSFLLDYLMHEKWALGIKMKNICFQTYAETISNEGSNECKFAAPKEALTTIMGRVPGLVVLGMHRSGTSLLSGLLVKGLKYVVPGRVMVGNEGNKYGYFENDNVAYQNDVWLNEQGMHWNKLKIRTDPQDSRIIVGGFDPNFSCITDYCAKAKHKRPNYFQNRKIALLHYNNDTLTDPWLLKDPRLCITLPMWLPSLRGSPPAVLFTFRHPLEVAKSLARRKINYVRLQSDGLKLWIWYNRLSLMNSQSLCRVVTSNEAIIRDPISEISRINDELAKCGLPLRQLNATELMGFFHADIMHLNSNNGKDSLPSNKAEDCTIPPLEPSEVPKGDFNFPQVYLKAMVIYCDLKNGKAFNANYSWPLLPSPV